MDIFEKALAAMHGEVTVKTRFGETKKGLGPDGWIEKVVQDDCISPVSLMGIVLYRLGSPFRALTEQEERHLINQWWRKLNDGVHSGSIDARDPVSLLRIWPKKSSTDWVISIEEADQFVQNLGHGWKVSEEVAHLYKESVHYVPSIDDAVQADETSRPIATRERNTYLNIIGGLLEICNQKEAAIIATLIERHPEKSGIKKRTLEEKFAEAKRSLNSN